MSPTIERDLQWTTCQVVDANAVTDSHRGEEYWQVVLEAANCPTLIYTDGITEDNAQQIADTFEPGPYEVRVHESAIRPDGYVRYAQELAIHAYRPDPGSTS